MSELTTHSSSPDAPAPSYYTNDPITIDQDLIEEVLTIQAHYNAPSPTHSVQYVPSSPTPSIQEVDPPPLHVRINQAAEGGPYPPLSPGSAKTIIRMGGDEEFRATAQAVMFGLVATIH